MIDEQEPPRGLPAGLTDDIAAIAAVMAEHGLEKINVEANGIRLTMAAPRAPRGIESVAPIVTAEVIEPAGISANGRDAGHTIAAPIVGTYYAAPGPGELPFVQVGDLVSPGQTVAIIEQMKFMNEIQADRGGVVEEIFVSNGQPVEYDQPLMRLAP
jgi:acetyl-CoA carboxylase biotin carboxyl carrier protein